MSALRIGTRGSALALVQSARVADALRHAGHAVELVEIRTAGDRLTDVPLGPGLGSSFFTREIETALLDERIDLAVHSCKDLATVLPPGLSIAAVPEREDPRDALVSAGPTLAELPHGARVGTSSPRRKGFLAVARPDLRVEDQRGNVPTRVAALDAGRYDAVVLAAAGLRRLGLTGRIVERFAPELMLPAAAQGALAVEIRAGDARVAAAVEPLDDPRAHAEVRAERACLRRLGAGCQAPVGALARVEAAGLRIETAALTPDGIFRASGAGSAADAEAVGARAAEELLGALGVASLSGAAWAGPPPLRPVPT